MGSLNSRWCKKILGSALDVGHRIIQVIGNLWRSLVQQPQSKVSLDQIAQSFIQSNFECPQGWRFPHTSGPLCWAISKVNFSPISNPSFPFCNLYSLPLLSCLCAHQGDVQIHQDPFRACCISLANQIVGHKFPILDRGLWAFWAPWILPVWAGLDGRVLNPSHLCNRVRICCYCDWRHPKQHPNITPITHFQDQTGASGSGEKGHMVAFGLLHPPGETKTRIIKVACSPSWLTTEPRNSFSPLPWALLQTAWGHTAWGHAQTQLLVTGSQAGGPLPVHFGSWESSQWKTELWCVWLCLAGGKKN